MHIIFESVVMLFTQNYQNQSMLVETTALRSQHFLRQSQCIALTSQTTLHNDALDFTSCKATIINTVSLPLTNLLSMLTINQATQFSFKCSFKLVTFSKSYARKQKWMFISERSVQYGSVFHMTHHRSFCRQFYGSNDPTNSVIIAVKDNGQSTRSRVNPTRLISLKHKVKTVTKKNLIYIAPQRPKTQRRQENRELNQARSKPDSVDQPVKTARSIAHHYNFTQYFSKETVLLIFPFLQTNITSQ